jgi:Fic family protein
LLITFFLCERGFLSLPFLYLSAFFERHREEYYSRLLDVSQSSNWQDWIKFFLRGVATQGKEGIEDAKRIINLHTKYQTMVQETKKIPESAHKLVDELFSNPIISISGLSKKWGVSFNSVKTGVLRLVDVGILKELGEKKRNRLFVASELLDMLLEAS